MIKRYFSNLTNLLFVVCFLFCSCKESHIVNKQSNLPSNAENNQSIITVPEPETHTNEVTQTVPRVDLPLNWFEVKQDSWSFGLPSDFDEIAPIEGSISSYFNKFNNLKIEFRTYDTTIGDIHQFVLIDFIIVKMNLGAEVLGQREKSKDGIITLAVNLLYPKLNTTRIASLDFFRKNNRTVYHISCTSDVLSLKSNSDICFKIADTLNIK